MLCTVVRDLISIGHDSGGFHVNTQICLSFSISSGTFELHAVSGHYLKF